MATLAPFAVLSLLWLRQALHLTPDAVSLFRPQVSSTSAPLSNRISGIFSLLFLPLQALFPELPRLLPETIRILHPFRARFCLDLFFSGTEIMHPLFCHPTGPIGAVHSLEASAERFADGSVKMVYCLHAALGQLVMPLTRNASRADGLWQHSCFEVFIACEGESAYREFNFSPAAQWAAYAFSHYRQPAATWPMPPPRISSHVDVDRFVLHAILPPEALPPDSVRRPLRIALSAVLESYQGLSYWALHHPVARADFHHPESFVLSLPAFSF